MTNPNRNFIKKLKLSAHLADRKYIMDYTKIYDDYVNEKITLEQAKKELTKLNKKK